ncbi:classical arabinogalactan protein 9-like, partial [Varroa jacobsoni]|uniref:classical arabinogalactan protein 9-like n=1 Tax=Varroa jacobsoni TaxID=62625 RepID=UPI000BF5B7CF
MGQIRSKQKATVTESSKGPGNANKNKNQKAAEGEIAGGDITGVTTVAIGAAAVETEPAATGVAKETVARTNSVPRPVLTSVPHAAKPEAELGATLAAETSKEPAAKTDPLPPLPMSEPPTAEPRPVEAPTADVEAPPATPATVAPAPAVAPAVAAPAEVPAVAAPAEVPAVAAPAEVPAV